MRLQRTAMLVAGLGAWLAGCAPDLVTSDGADSIDALTGLLGSAASASVVAAPSDEPSAATPTARSTGAGTAWELALEGAVEGRGSYQLFEVGEVLAGDRWTITPSQLSGTSSILVVLFDAKYDLLNRQVLSPWTGMEHIVRANSDMLYVGVAPVYGGNGGNFTLDVAWGGEAAVPATRSQVVWLNFGTGNDVRVHSRAGIDFEPFDAAALGTAYAGQTTAMKAAIVEAVRLDYAPYNVVVLSSDDGPPPKGAYATLHFGGDDGQLLGLADNVDVYNADPAQAAVIYAQAFADFAVMELSAEEMGQMIGNTASHELGHLLGLFHTATPADVMDTTGTAWDLARDQEFSRGQLEPTVFPMGYENSPLRLAETVGRKADSDKTGDVTKSLDAAKIRRKAELRSVLRDELRSRCGTCLHLDE